MIARTMLWTSLALAGNALAASDTIEMERRATAERAGYDGKQAYLEESAAVKKAGETWRMRQRRDAIAMADAFLLEHPYSLRMQAAAANFKEDMSHLPGDRDERVRYGRESRIHRLQLARLVKSISQGSQCASFEDACRVIQIGEEQAFLEYTGGLRIVESVRVKSPRGVPFDVLTVTDREDGQRKYYFDVSAFVRIAG